MIEFYIGDMKMNMLDFLMGHDIELVCNETGRVMSADSLHVLSGEFTVYPPHGNRAIYRGTDFTLAVEYLEGKEEE